MDSARFEADLVSDGYDRIETRSLPAGTCTSEHDHPFAVRALVVEGEITITIGGAARTYAAGDVFAVAGGCRHAEQIGAAGVTYVVGRRDVAAG